MNKGLLFLWMGAIYLFRNLVKFSYRLLGKKYYVYPHLVDIKITYRCNLHCQQCRDYEKSSAGELTTEEWKRILLDLRKTIGPFIVRFYGGEPFLRDDLMELIEFCTVNQIIVLITTNGTLIDEPIAKRLKENNIALINISLDGRKAETHDTLRGRAGAFEKAYGAIKLLKNDINIQINTTLMQQNLNEMLDLIDLAEEEGVQISLQGLLNFMEETNEFGLDRNHFLMPKDIVQVEKVFDSIIVKKSKALVTPQKRLMNLKNYYCLNKPSFYGKCSAVLHHLKIKPTGELYICVFSGLVGNMKKMRLKQIWRSKEFMKEVEELENCVKTHCLVMRGCSRESLKELGLKVYELLIKTKPIRR